MGDGGKRGGWSLMRVQKTLTGETTDRPRVVPDTLIFCAHCGDRVLRSEWDEHEDHHLEQVRKVQEEASTGGFEDDEEEPAEEVGAVYNVTLSYSVDYRFRIPAATKNEAKGLAKERVLYPENCSSADLVHTRIDDRGTVMSDDERLPEDYDPYGGERLWEAFERAEEGED